MASNCKNTDCRPWSVLCRTCGWSTSGATTEYLAEWFAYWHTCPSGSRAADIELSSGHELLHGGSITAHVLAEAEDRIPWIPYDEYLTPWGPKTRPPTTLPEYGGFRVVP